MKRHLSIALLCAVLLSSCSTYHKVAVWYKYRKDFKLPKPQEQPNTGIARKPTILIPEAGKATQDQPEAEVEVAQASNGTSVVLQKHALIKSGIRQNSQARHRRITELKRWTNLKLNPYAVPQQYDPTVTKKQPPFAVAGFVLSLLGLFILGIVLGALGIIFSSLALAKASKDSSRYKKGLAIAGLIIGIIAFFGSIILIAAVA